MNDDKLNKLLLPSFTNNLIEITKKDAKRKVEEITKQKDEAILAKDDELAIKLQSKLDEIKLLDHQLKNSQEQSNTLQIELQKVLAKPKPQISQNAILLNNGMILLVKHKGKYGAIQAIDQSSSSRGSFIRYSWWYQPNNSNNFINENTQHGFGKTSETTSYHKVKIGPIELAWSISGEGRSWIYFTPDNFPSVEYELAITNHFDIGSIIIDDFQNQFINSGFEYTVIFHNLIENTYKLFENKVSKLPDFDFIRMIEGKDRAVLIIRNPLSKKLVENIANDLGFLITVEEHWKN
ncbi:MAG: hypothetical protein ACR2MD_12685 [Aridibacter sp.]